MKAQSTAQTKTASTSVFNSARSRILQRKCESCGQHTIAGGVCGECANKKSGLQRKLAIGASNDPLEWEADRVADQVMAASTSAAASDEPPRIQRFTGQLTEGSESAPASIDHVLSSPGRPLEPSLQRDMGQRFGHDFSRVRVHTDAAAERSARDVNANAYTVGHNIVFGARQFAPGTHEGRRLIAHELTHVVQQSGTDRIHTGHDNGRGSVLPIHQAGTSAPGVIQRDESGGGSTTFQDTVNYVDTGSNDLDIIEGTVTRTETAPKSDSQPEQEISKREMHITFDPSDCSITIPFGYNFVQAAQAVHTGICDDPPASTVVPLLPNDAFNRLKASLLVEVNSGLSGWFDIRLSGDNCPHGCANRALPIRTNAHEDTAHPDTTITVVNRGGRANAGTICVGSWDRPTAVHEAGHQVLGVGDEYPERDERLRATMPQWFRPERVRRDYSMMGPELHTRFAMFHERHFNAVKTFLEVAFPGCTATLQARSRPIIPDYRFALGGGYASVNGLSGYFIGAGLRLGIPLDRLRRWEVVLGPQLNFISGSADDNRRNQDAILLGARLGLERSTGEAGHGFTGGAFAEFGHGWFSSKDSAPGRSYSHKTRAAYGDFGVSAGYRTPIAKNVRGDFRIEGAAGSAIGTPSIIDSTTRDMESTPERSYWFRLGLSIGIQF
jgi:hypothetical protein